MCNSWEYAYSNDPQTYEKLKTIRVIVKKIDYFSPNSIDDKAKQMLEKIKALGLSHLEMKFDPKKAALLVLDAQKYFFSYNSHAFIPSAPAIIPNIQNIIEEFYINKRPIYFSKHVNDHNSAGMMAVWWRDLLERNSELSNLIEEIDIEKGKVFQKERYDAFWKTSLDEMLKNNGVEQIVICGVMTHLCCETTARSAFVRDYQVFFAIDGTATYTENLHMASLTTLAHGFARTILCKDIPFR